MPTQNATQKKSKFNDISGRVFAHWTVIHRIEKPDRGKSSDRSAMWLCRCSCGVKRVVKSASLTSGGSSSCGHAPYKLQSAPKEDLTGRVFGEYTVVRPVRNTTPRQGFSWLCACSCGVERVVCSASLKSGNSKSCGCFSAANTRKRMTTHGATGTKEYSIWASMIARCENENVVAFPDYGGRGIFICRRWRNSFQDFIADMGFPPTPDHTLDRINNDQGYLCGACEECLSVGPNRTNCRWATRTEQCNNRRSSRMLTYDGKTMSVADWAREKGVGYRVIQQRVTRLGWTVEEALTTPPQKNQHVAR